MGVGRYQTVNIVGVAVISGMVNTPDGQIFPKVFGSDGAGFAVPGTGYRVPGAGVEATRETPATLQNWAEAEFAIILCYAGLCGGYPRSWSRFARFLLCVVLRG